MKIFVIQKKPDPLSNTKHSGNNCDIFCEIIYMQPCQLYCRRFGSGSRINDLGAREAL